MINNSLAQSTLCLLGWHVTLWQTSSWKKFALENSYKWVYHDYSVVSCHLQVLYVHDMKFPLKTAEGWSTPFQRPRVVYKNKPSVVQKYCRFFKNRLLKQTDTLNTNQHLLSLCTTDLLKTWSGPWPSPCVQKHKLYRDFSLWSRQFGSVF